MNISNLILNLNKFYPFLFHCIHELNSIAQEGPVPAKSFYGPVDPSTSVKVITSVPTAKAAFSARAGDFKESENSKEPAQNKKQRENMHWIFWLQESSSVSRNFWNSFCREHRPKQIPTTAIVVEKVNNNKK